MIRRIFMLGAISLAAVSAADKSDKFSVNLYQPVVLNGTTFKAGDANGQGFGGIWFVVTASGTAPAPAATTPTTAKSSGGYGY